MRFFAVLYLGMSLIAIGTIFEGDELCFDYQYCLETLLFGQFVPFEVEEKSSSLMHYDVAKRFIDLFFLLHFGEQN